MNCCPVCKSTNTELLVELSSDYQKEKLLEYDLKYYEGKLKTIFSETQYKINQCNDCDHLYYSEPLELNQLSEMYLAHAVNLKKKHKNIQGNNFDILKSLIKKYIHIWGKDNPKILDYGSGAGIWSQAAYDIGEDVTAFEPHIERVEHTGYEMINDLNDLKKQKFDIIFLNQVLEHTLDPIFELKTIRDLTKNGSILISSVPNAGAISKKNFIKTWPYHNTSHVMAPFQHLHGFSQNSFLRAHKIAGFNYKYFDNANSFRNFLKYSLAEVGKYFHKSISTSFIFRLDQNL